MIDQWNDVDSQIIFKKKTSRCFCSVDCAVPTVAFGCSAPFAGDRDLLLNRKSAGLMDGMDGGLFLLIARKVGNTVVLQCTRECCAAADGGLALSKLGLRSHQYQLASSPVVDANST